jgi:hypothetical protein
MGAVMLGCSRKTASQQQNQPAVLLQATLTNHGIGGFRHSSLLVRLTDDGKVEWDDLEWSPASTRKMTIVGLETVASIERRLGPMDLTGIRDKMGPYNAYIDTSYDIGIRMRRASFEPIEFTVINPWCGESETCIDSKRMPQNLLSILCEIEDLRAEVAQKPKRGECDGRKDQNVKGPANMLRGW